MARICIITPGHVGSNPRVVKEADALAAAGHDVRVVATKAIDFVEPRDQAIARDARWRLHRVAFVGRMDWLKARSRQGIAQRLFKVMPTLALAEAAHSAVTPLLTRAAAAEPADLYIAHYVAALPAAAKAARKHGARFAFDAEDFHTGDLPATSETEAARGAIGRLESRYLPLTATITAASPLIAEAYTVGYGIPLSPVVLNVFPRSNAPDIPTPAGTAAGPSVYWFSQTIGSGRGLEAAVDAIAIARSRPHLYLRGTPSAGYAETLMARADKLGVADRLHILPPALPQEMERLGAAYDLGYVGEMAETKSRQIALTNKLFSYLLGGVPSLASDIPAHRAIAPDLGAAITLFPIGDAQALAAAMDGFLLSPERLAAARAHAWNLGQDRYCWDVEQRVLLDVVERNLPRMSQGVSARSRPHVAKPLDVEVVR